MGMQVGGWGRLAVRRLLQLDEPIHERSEAELEAEMRANYLWNFAVNLGDGVFFWLGLSLFPRRPSFRSFLANLRSIPFGFPFLPFLGSPAWFLPHLFPF